MKRLLLLLLTLCLLTGCVGKTVVQNDPAVPNTNTDTPPSAETAVKTGLALLTTISKSMNATPDSKGSARTDTTVVAVTVVIILLVSLTVALTLASEELRRRLLLSL
jgi:PBP1b-binding outer membrane lipoprotein LpoB